MVHDKNVEEHLSIDISVWRRILQTTTYWIRIDYYAYENTI